MDYIDISPTLSGRIAVYPGDKPFRREVAMSFEAGDHLALSSLETTVHVGAHVDAPNHYHPDGCDIASRDLGYYLGECQVVSVEVEPGARIYPRDLEGVEIRARRLLFATGSFPDPDRWRSDFNALSPELVHWLADRGVILVGIDTPSIDPEQSKALESHQAVAARDMAILEGVVLSAAPAGLYWLMALPLKIEGADASPVRAVLLKVDPTVTGSKSGGS